MQFRVIIYEPECIGIVPAGLTFCSGQQAEPLIHVVQRLGATDEMLEL